MFTKCFPCYVSCFLFQPPSSSSRPGGTPACRNEPFSLPIRLSPLHLIKAPHLPSMAQPLACCVISYWDKSPPFSSQCQSPLECRLFVAWRDNMFISFQKWIRFFLLLAISPLAYPFPSPAFKQIAGSLLHQRKDAIAGKQRQQTNNSNDKTPGSHRCWFLKANHSGN